MPLSTSGDTDGVFKPFKAVTPSLKIFLYLASSSALLLLGWFLFALLPSRKAGTGVHVLPSSIRTLYSPGSGYIYFPKQIKNDILETEEVARIRDSRTLDKSIIEYLRQEEEGFNPRGDQLRSVSQYESVSPLLSPLKKDINNTITSGAETQFCQDPNKTLAYIENNNTKSDLENSLMVGASFAAVVKTQQSNYRKAISSALDIYKQNKNIADSAESLFKEGIISKATLAQYASEEANDFNNVIGIKSNKSTAFQNALTATLTARNKLQTYLSQSFLLAPSTTCVVSQIVAAGTFVEANSPILITTTAKGAYPGIVPVYVNADYVADIKKGDDAIMTPAGFSTTQFGGIKGKVISISKTIQTGGQILKTLGVDTVSNEIQNTMSSPFLIEVKLKKSDKTKSGYEWTSSQGPAFRIPITTLMNATIITDRVSPASMALPALRNLFTSNPMPTGGDQ